MDTNKIGAQVLARAAAKLGGAHALAQHLGISRGVLSRYVTGSAAVPDSLFLRAVDVILDELTARPGNLDGALGHVAERPAPSGEQSSSSR